MGMTSEQQDTLTQAMQLTNYLIKQFAPVMSDMEKYCTATYLQNALAFHGVHPTPPVKESSDNE